MWLELCESEFDATATAHTRAELKGRKGGKEGRRGSKGDKVGGWVEDGETHFKPTHWPGAQGTARGTETAQTRRKRDAERLSPGTTPKRTLMWTMWTVSMRLMYAVLVVRCFARLMT